MESKYYPLAYILIIVSSIARQTMNVAAVRVNEMKLSIDVLLCSDIRPAVWW